MNRSITGLPATNKESSRLQPSLQQLSPVPADQGRQTSGARRVSTGRRSIRLLHPLSQNPVSRPPIPPGTVEADGDWLRIPLITQKDAPLRAPNDIRQW